MADIATTHVVTVADTAEYAEMLAYLNASGTPFTKVEDEPALKITLTLQHQFTVPA